MALCPQCGDFLRPQATTCRECGWGAKRASGKPSEPTAWSPPTPPIATLPAYTGPRWVIPAAIQAELDALKAKCVTTPSGRRVDPELERRYLENLAKKRGTT